MLKYLILFFVCLNVYAEDEFIVNQRAAQCKSFSFDELNSLNKNALESVYCGYIVGDSISKITIDSQSEKHTNDANMQVYLAETRLKELKKCAEPKEQVLDLFNRKFIGQKLECEKYKGFKNITSDKK